MRRSAAGSPVVHCMRFTACSLRRNRRRHRCGRLIGVGLARVVQKAAGSCLSDACFTSCKERGGIPRLLVVRSHGSAAGFTPRAKRCARFGVQERPRPMGAIEAGPAPKSRVLKKKFVLMEKPVLMTDSSADRSSLQMWRMVFPEETGSPENAWRRHPRGACTGHPAEAIRRARGSGVRNLRSAWMRPASS